MNTNRKISAATMLLSALAATNAAGQVSNWASAVNGNWNDATKWDNGIPLVSTQSAVLGLAGGYSVTLNTSPTINELHVTNPGAILTISPATTLGLAGSSITNEGRIQINPTGSASNGILRIDNALTLSGSGEIWMRSQGSDDSQITGLGDLTNAAGHEIRGVGQISIPTTNDGTIAADVSVSVSGGTLTLFSDVVNNAMLEGRPGSNLDLSGVTIDQTAGGSLFADNTGNINVTSVDATVLFGTIETAGSGEFNINPAGVGLLSGVINNGTIEVLFNGSLHIDSMGIENNGTIDMNRAGSASDSTFLATQSAEISGNGVINMKALGSNDTQINTDIGAVLTHGVDHEIRGVGYINAELVNDGIITADVGVSVSGNTLVMQTNPKTNNDLMIAASGSILQFSGITLDQLGGGQLVTNGGEVRLFNTTVLGGVYNAFGGLLRSQPGTNSISGITLNGPSIIEPNSTVVVDAEGMVNNGVMQINPVGSASNSVVTFSETASLAGTGEFQLRSEGSDDSQVNTAVGAILTHASTHLIRGVGQVNAALINNGEVRADSSVSVSGGTLTVQTNNQVNNALMVAAPSSTLRFIGVDVDQTGGGMLVADSGLISLLSANFTGGSYVATGTGALTTFSGVSSVAGMTFDGPATVVPGTTLAIGTGGLVNNGVLQVNPSGSASNAVVVATDSIGLTGNGEIRMRSQGSDDSQVNTDEGMVITQGANHSIRGVGYVNAALVNNGTISADSSVSVSGGTLELQTENKTNAGFITAEASSTLFVDGITLTQTGSGSLEANNGSIVFGSGATLSGGTVNSSGTGSYTVSGSATFDGVTLNSPGTVNFATTLDVTSPTLTNNSLIRVNPQQSASDGVIAFPANGTIAGSGEINLLANLFDSQIAGPGTVTNASGHTISGRGTVSAPFINQGTINPGNTGVGTLNASSGVTLSPTSVLNIELAGNNSSDRLAVTGTANLGGTLNVAMFGASMPTLNFNYTILTADNVVGTFDNDNIIIDGNLITRVVYEPTQVRILTRCLGDTNLDGAVTAADFSAWVSAYNAGSDIADQNLDGNVSPADFSAWVSNFNQGCP